jgi:hypothetical protein
VRYKRKEKSFRLVRHNGTVLVYNAYTVCCSDFCGCLRILTENMLKGIYHRLITKQIHDPSPLTRDFMTWDFFHKSVYPGPLSIPLGPFRIFSKIRGDIREWMFISGVNDTGEKREKFWNRFFYIFCWELSLVHFTRKVWIFAYF